MSGHRFRWVTRIGHGAARVVAGAGGLVVVFGLAVFTAGSVTLAEGERERSVANQNQSRPNVLILMADNWAWPHASACGDPVVTTPTFDSVCRDGMRFDRAYCSVPSCAPARAVFLTGQASHRLEDAASLHGRFAAKFRVFPEQLEQHGYLVGHSGKGWGPGNIRESGRTRNPAGEKYDDFESFLAKVTADKPFCFWMSSRDPHVPWTEGREFLDTLRRDKLIIPSHLPDHPSVREDMLGYYCEVRNFDRDCGKIIDRLKERGLLDNTLVIMTGDNGWQMPRGLAHIYDLGTHVPLAIRWPSLIKPGSVCDAFVSFEDFAPTLFEATGLPALPDVTGRSFVGCLKGEADPGRDATFLERERHANVRYGDLSYPVRAVRTKEFLYVRNLRPERWPAGDPFVHHAVGPFGDVDGSLSKTLLLAERSRAEMRKFFDLTFGKRPAEELYDLWKDPGETRNVAGEAEYAAAKAGLAERLETWRRTTADPRLTNDDDRFDRYPYYGGPAKKEAGGERPALAGTQPLDLREPLDEFMVRGLDRFCLREIEASRGRRERFWSRDYTSPEAYTASVAKNRERFRQTIGAVDPREPARGFLLQASLTHDGVVAEGDGMRMRGVTWPVLSGVTGEGLLVEMFDGIASNSPVTMLRKLNDRNGPARTGRSPDDKGPRARIVLVPDADVSPELMAGVGRQPASGLMRRLVHAGCQVVIPSLINRDDTYSGNPAIRMTNQPHREFIYRQAYELGRHIIGYEVQKILAAVDQFEQMNHDEEVDTPIVVAGEGEGGLLALYAGALDTRIAVTYVSGYFGPREGVWREPIYRNVWGLLDEFGDAELASLICPRKLCIETTSVSPVWGPPAPRAGRAGSAPGEIASVSPEDAEPEFQRAKTHFDKLALKDAIVHVVNSPARVGLSDRWAYSTSNSLLSLIAGKPITIGIDARDLGPHPLVDRRGEVPFGDRQKRQVDELTRFTQQVMRDSAKERDRLWSRVDRTNLDNWSRTVPAMRKFVHEELIGRLPAPDMPLNPRSRQVLDEPEYQGFEVMLDVYPDVVAGGLLLLPTDLKPGDKRPVVVCQHGLEGTAMDVVTSEGRSHQYYKGFAAELAKRGFITFAPQNPYRGQDRFRTLQRKSNPLRRTLFSYIIPQHERILEFLKTRPEVDGDRIGFYGLSYGGKTAVRVPPLVEGYALSICSADYNEWVVKNATVSDRYSYVFTGEYEMFDWNLGHIANYAELTSLMIPRPFMVERGHHDGVAPDEWVAWEFAKARRSFALLGLGDRCGIEYFVGPHSINGQATYAFLHKHLAWPEKR